MLVRVKCCGFSSSPFCECAAVHNNAASLGIDFVSYQRPGFDVNTMAFEWREEASVCFRNGFGCRGSRQALGWLRALGDARQLLSPCPKSSPPFTRASHGPYRKRSIVALCIPKTIASAIDSDADHPQATLANTIQRLRRLRDIQ
jgi:hypothetical protein